MFQIQIKFRKENDMNRSQKICITILLTISVFFTGFYCSLMVQAKDNAPETAYQEFLEGRRMLHIDEEMHDILKELPYADGMGDLGCGNFSMKEILKKMNEFYYEDYEENNRIAYIEYAYLDCGSDGGRELAVRFDARMPVDEFKLTFIIVYENGTLYLRHALEAWSRNRISINKYGYIWNFGSGGAFAGGSYEALVNDSGRADYVFDMDYDWRDIDEPEICQQVYGTEEYSFQKVRYQIQDKEYLCLLDGSGEEPDDDDFKQFKELYEKKNGKIYTQEEINKLIERRKKTLGITDEMMDQSEPDWNILEAATFKDQVREIELKENRKKAKENNDAVVTNGWESCNKEYIKNGLYLHNAYSLQYDWEKAVEYALEDYSHKENIPDTEWTLLQTVSYGDMLHAVTVQSEEERVLCLMLCGDAAELGLPEYTEYLMVADCYQNDNGFVCDSALLWNSINSRTKQTYSFEVETGRLRNYWYAEKALKRYLTDQEADTDSKWKIDENSVCAIDSSIMIVRFVSEEQEIVMAVDSKFDDPKFSVIKKKGIKKKDRSDWEKAYDQIEWGDWSDIQNFDEPELPVKVAQMRWIRRDLNHDEIPELLCLSNKSFWGGHLAIEYIFTYHDNNTEIVFTDQTDDSEYYFLGRNGNLLCDYSSYAIDKYHSISKCEFDADWKPQKQERLEAAYDVDENKISCLKEVPLITDALSQDGAGEEWNVIPISANVFLEEYHWLTGEDFLEKGNNWELLFRNAGDAVSDSGFMYGKWEPDLTENEFVKAVKKCETSKENCSSLTYAADYDGNGTIEAFVVIGDDDYEKEMNRFDGESLWFVDSRHKAVKLMESLPDNARMQQYMKKGNNIYLFFVHYGHAIVRSWETPVYTVQNNQPVCVEESLSYTYKYIDKYGKIMVEQDAYDHFYDGIREDGGEPFSFWTGHTWKYYPFRLIDNRLLEMGACELSAEAVKDISPLPISVQKELRGDEEHPVVGVQYLLRDNGDLNINYVSGNSYGTDELDFNNVTLRLNETNQWVVSDYNGGTYMINFSEGKKWTFLENLDRKLELKICSE